MVRSAPLSQCTWRDGGREWQSLARGVVKHPAKLLPADADITSTQTLRFC